MRLKYDIYANGQKTRDTKYVEGNKATTHYLELLEKYATNEFARFKNFHVKKSYLQSKKQLYKIEFSFTNNGGTRIRHIYELVK